MNDAVTFAMGSAISAPCLISCSQTCCQHDAYSLASRLLKLKSRTFASRRRFVLNGILEAMFLCVSFGTKHTRRK